MRLFWKLFWSYVLVTGIAALAIGVSAASAMRTFYRAEVSKDLWHRTTLLMPYVTDLVEQGDLDGLQRLVEHLGRATDTRITVVGLDGAVMGDTYEIAAAMDNHADRPEVIEALERGRGETTRFSHTLQETLLYVAVPIERGGGAFGVLRTAVPLAGVRERLAGMWVDVAWPAAFVGLMMLAISWWMSRRVSRPLEHMRAGAVSYAKGALDERLPIPDTRELAELAESMNQMAAQLDERMKTVERQRNEKAAVFSSMVESVVAVDRSARILTLNQAAAALLDIDPQHAVGQSLQLVVRNTALQRLVADTLRSSEPVEREITFQRPGQQQVVQAHGTLLHDAQGAVSGAVVVLHDLTRLRRLEQVRRDFVANVSHELKTPITAIKGFVETLLDGALKDEAEARNFLGIVLKQADRLNNIIEDLLTLSRIEQDETKAESLLQRGSIRKVLEAAVQVCSAGAENKQIRLILESDDALEALINPPLLEQAVTNLIDNAIKYSGTGKSVWVEGRRLESEVVIRVRDEGAGIPKEHLSRLFERFYRVDRARSRQLGGTGLGLAIVKHIAQAHSGAVTVESVVGRGSVFTLSLPLLAAGAKAS